MIARFLPVIGNSLRCTGSWGTQILNDTKKKICKKCQLGELPAGEVLVGGSASWGTNDSWGTKI